MEGHTGCLPLAAHPCPCGMLSARRAQQQARSGLRHWLRRQGAAQGAAPRDAGRHRCPVLQGVHHPTGRLACCDRQGAWHSPAIATTPFPLPCQLRFQGYAQRPVALPRHLTPTPLNLLLLPGGGVHQGWCGCGGQGCSGSGSGCRRGHHLRTHRPHSEPQARAAVDAGASVVLMQHPCAPWCLLLCRASATHVPAAAS